MKNAEYYSDNYREAWSNLTNRVGGDCRIVDIEDAIEDAKTAEELRDNLNALKLIRTFSIDRVTDEYVRLISVDALGNRKYLKAYF